MSETITRSYKFDELYIDNKKYENVYVEYEFITKGTKPENDIDAYVPILSVCRIYLKKENNENN